MGLAERRVTKEFQDTHFPRLKKALDQAAGLELPLEVKWEQLATDGQSHLYLESWDKVYFQPLTAAFKDLCRDQMGKDAVKAALKKVVIQNTKDGYSSAWATFEGGVLTLDHHPCTNVDDVKDRTRNVVEVLEKAL